MVSAVRKTRTPETRTSDRSKPAEASTSSPEWSSGFCQRPCPESSSLCVDMLRLQYLRNMRVVGLHQRTRFQLHAVKGRPKGCHRHRHGDVFKDSPTEAQVARRILEVRLDQPEKVEGPGEDHPLANPHEALLVALQIARQEQR